MANNMVKVYTDGACRGNPGPGGWGVLIRDTQGERRLYGGERSTTNNRMELMAAIQALESLPTGCRVELTTDSQYVKNGITQWITGWKAKGWRTASKQPVKNQDLWKRLDSAVQQHDVIWHWVRGHTGHPENELADQLANRGIDELG